MLLFELCGLQRPEFAGREGELFVDAEAVEPDGVRLLEIHVEQADLARLGEVAVGNVVAFRAGDALVVGDVDVAARLVGDGAVDIAQKAGGAVDAAGALVHVERAGIGPGVQQDAAAAA